ncbi:hypothetical protein TNCV_1734271 [Trichonephila clavipes]|nr:hypothetical protein TNCV_1734271 [Trichonephila clavipes]
MVLVKEDNLPPLQWSLGRVVQVFPGDDGAVRVVDVKTQRGQFRPIEVSSRPKLTEIVRGLTCFAQTSDRLPRLTRTYPIMPNVMDMIESNID